MVQAIEAGWFALKAAVSKGVCPTRGAAKMPVRDSGKKIPEPTMIILCVLLFEDVCAA